MSVDLHNDLLRDLMPAELELVLPMLQKREYAAGQSIVGRGEPDAHLYVIESGFVYVAVPKPGGGETVAAQLGPGQVFGEMSVLTGQPRPAEVRALVDTVAYALPLPSFFQAAGHAPTMLLNVLRVMARWLNQSAAAASPRQRRSLVALVGPMSMRIGSIIATNLAASLAFVSGRSTMLLDLPAELAARLPNREFSPSIEQIRLGEESLAQLSQLSVGAVKLHVVNLPESDGQPSERAELVGRSLGKLTQMAELVVVNLTGPSGDLVDQILPMASRVYVVAASSQVGDANLAALTRRCRSLLGPTARLEAIALADDRAPPKTIRQRVQAALDIQECVTLPSRADLLREAARVEPPITLHAPRRPVSRTVSRLARDIAGLRIGLALGAGAARGVAHVGVLEKLQQLDVPIDTVAGTSVGAVVGAGVAMGLETGQIEEGMNRMMDLWSQALKPVLSRHGRYDPRVLDRIALGVAGDIRFDELAIPYGAVATDLNSGRTIYLCQGSVAQAVRASITIPMAFPPFPAGQYLLVDGSVTNPVPTTLARQLGADVVLACNLSEPAGESQQASLELGEEASNGTAGKRKRLNMLASTLRSVYLMMAGCSNFDCLSADVTFRPGLTDIGWNDFHKGPVALQAGKQAVEEQLDRLRELLPALQLTK